MTIKSAEDLDKLKRIGRIVALTLREMRQQLRPGMTTGELDDIGLRMLEKHGAQSAPRLVYNFPGATCISVNSEAAHGIPGDRVVQEGDLVNIDVSAELDGFFADTGASVPVLPVDPQIQRLCAFTRRALRRALEVARHGRFIQGVGKVVENEARKGGFQVIRNLCGHGVGRSLHEYPDSITSFYNAADRRRFTEGLALAIEPFLSTGATEVETASDNWTQITPDGSITAQYEHTIVITRKKPIVVTAL